MPEALGATCFHNAAAGSRNRGFETIWPVSCESALSWDLCWGFLFMDAPCKHTGSTRECLILRGPPSRFSVSREGILVAQPPKMGTPSRSHGPHKILARGVTITKVLLLTFHFMFHFLFHLIFHYRGDTITLNPQPETPLTATQNLAFLFRLQFLASS